MLDDVEAVRVVLERTFLEPVKESDARIVMDRINELLDPRSPTLREADGDTCPSCAGKGRIEPSFYGYQRCTK